MSTILSSILLTAAVGAAHAQVGLPSVHTSAPPREDRPVVLELFTSEGCSSCPPADALLRTMAQTRPDVLALAFHVTYWDDLGWRDPFSLDIATRRQRAYAATLPSDVYTPELVVDGRYGVVGSDRRAVDGAIRDARSAAGADGPRLDLTRDGNDAIVRADGGSGSGYVLLVGYDAEHTTSVGRGENGGRKLTEANIVRDVEMLGEWNSAATGAHAWRRPVPAGERLAVLVQSRDGHIIAATRESAAGVNPAVYDGAPITATPVYISPAPDVVVFVEPTLKPLMAALGAAYRARTGNPVRLFAAPSSMILKEIAHTRDDVIVLQGADVIANAPASRAVAAQPVRPLGFNHMVVARRGAGARENLAELKVSGPVALVDSAVPDELGALSHTAIQGTPLASVSKTFGVARGDDAIFLLEGGDASLAVLYRTDVVADPGLSEAAALPDPAGRIPVQAFLSADFNSPNSHDFMDFLATPEAHAIIAASGLSETAP